MQYAEKIGLTLLGSEAYNKIHSSVIIASALHDLGKCGRYGSPYYVANMVQDGRPTKKILNRNTRDQKVNRTRLVLICATLTTH